MEKLRVEGKDWNVWAAAWSAEAAWLEGARVNGVRNGEEERSAAVRALKHGFEDGEEKSIVWGAIVGIRRELDEIRHPGRAAGDLRCLRALAAHATTLTSVVRLWLACMPSLSEGPPESPPFSLPFHEVSALCAHLVKYDIWSSIYSVGMPSYAHVFLRPLTSLLLSYLRLSRRLPGISEDLWMAQAFSVIGRAIPGDEPHAVQAMEDLIDIITSDLMVSRGWNVPPVIWEKGGMSVVKPFLAHTFQPKDDVSIGSFYITPQSIMLSTTLRLPPAASVHSAVAGSLGLPVKRDWTLSPLDHLFRSGSSPAFKYPWDVSELEISRASLLLAKIAREVLCRYSLTEFILTREETVFGCMKIFMLEHGQPQNNASEEIFRDAIVGRFVEELLGPFTLAASTSSAPGSALPLPANEDPEKVAVHFLGSSTPFYQYYTDFVALYDAISFSQPLFSRLLLPPTSMRSALDYRRHLWGDYNHILKTIRTPVDQVITDDPAEYLWPVEHDPHMISSYLRSLISGRLEGFARLLAIHHIACNIWSDLHQGEASGEERGGKLLKAVVNQGDFNAVREVVLYRQTSPVLLPPKCFEQDGEWKTSRLEYACRLGDDVLIERLRGLLDGTL